MRGPPSWYLKKSAWSKCRRAVLRPPRNAARSLSLNPLCRLTTAFILGSVCALPPRLPQASDWPTPPSSRICTLDQVLDGDSMRLTCKGKSVEVRLHCIDAPEYEQIPWGKQSRHHLRKITPRKVELKTIEIDQFGRTLGEVYTTEPSRRFLNLEQVVGGHAAVYEHYCSDPAFTRAQRKARKAGLGIWSKPGAQQTPWVFRHRKGS
ncbi:thermonuclease family protein [uncultured Lamprocystis sp.]|uniref:thermonuclease family protein n=2 Tax=uncultured Lamprocystis sp. TaxID=543132 RepID=UPI0025E80B2D|nr:thermonuclease family protein [uncultured Lamprocystis sp.]